MNSCLAFLLEKEKRKAPQKKNIWAVSPLERKNYFR
jgi:hypothetical protein